MQRSAASRSPGPTRRNWLWPAPMWSGSCWSACSRSRPGSWRSDPAGT